jgi:diacylglycerol kinase (ATP)
VTRAAVAVVNPAAGGGRTGRRWPALREEFARLAGGVECVFTTGPGDGRRCAREAVAAGATLVVAVGGDGTLNEVVDAVVGAPGVTVGLVPTGRGRDAARNLGVALDARAAVRRLADGRDARIDLGLAEWDDGTRRHFVNAAGVGFDAEVARRARARGGAGTIPYVLAVVAALRAHRAVAARLEVGGAPGWTGALTAAIVANGAHYGGGMKIAPGADPADGRLDLVVLGAFGRLELLRWLPTVYRGGHVAHPSVRVQPVTRVRVEADAPLPTHLDGESGPPSPVTLGVRPAALRLRV